MKMQILYQSYYVVIYTPVSYALNLWLCSTQGTYIIIIHNTATLLYVLVCM